MGDDVELMLRLERMGLKKSLFSGKILKLNTYNIRETAHADISSTRSTSHGPT